MIGLNPAMVSYAIRAKADEILKGEYPEGLFLKEKTDTKIVLGIENPEAYEGITLNSILVSVIYKGIEIVFDHGNKESLSLTNNN